MLWNQQLRQERHGRLENFKVQSLDKPVFCVIIKLSTWHGEACRGKASPGVAGLGMARLGKDKILIVS